FLTLQWDIFNDRNDNTDVRMEFAKLLGIIAVNLNEKHFDDAFECLNDRQLDRVFIALIDGLKDTNKWGHESCAKFLEVISKKLNGKQLKIVINVLMSGLKYGNSCVRILCAKSLGIISEKLDEK
ncbi:hypothetical protein RFI_34098, partial [Reticulomyxa filosa]